MDLCALQGLTTIPLAGRHTPTSANGSATGPASQGNEIILDLCAYDNGDIIDALYLDCLRAADVRLLDALAWAAPLEWSLSHVARQVTGVEWHVTPPDEGRPPARACHATDHMGRHDI